MAHVEDPSSVLTVHVLQLTTAYNSSSNGPVAPHRLQSHLYSSEVSGGDYKEHLGKVQFTSVAQLCLTLCDPMDCSTPGLPVYHQLLEFTQTCVH